MRGILRRQSISDEMAFRIDSAQTVRSKFSPAPNIPGLPSGVMNIAGLGGNTSTPCYRTAVQEQNK